MSRVMRKQTFWFLTWSDTNQAVQLQKMARGLKFQIWKVEGSYYLCSKNKGADQSFAVTAKLICVFVFTYAKCWFSCDAAHMHVSYFPMTRLHMHLSRVIRKPTFCICENKDADQLRGNREADQRLCFSLHR